MLRFVWVYVVAILLAMGISSYFTKHAASMRQANGGAVPARGYAATPAASPSFGSALQQVAGDRMGNYVAPVQVDGRDLSMLIDTGASFVSLTSEDASALGLRPAPAEFTLQMQTANGISTAARTWLRRVRVGAVEVHDVEAIIMSPGASRTSLLGMSFLSKLHRFGVANGQMQLEQ